MKRFSLVIATLGVLFSCTPKEDQPQNNNLAPSVTVGAESISAVSAVLCGEANLESSMSSYMTMGIMLSTNSGVLPSNSTKIEATDISAKQGSSKCYNYKVNALSLSPATTYFYRSYITQNGQDTYGETKEFKTKESASLLCTQEASDVSAASAKLNASLDLTDVQYSSIEAGFLWSTSEDSQSTSIKASELENGSFYTMLGSLSHKTQYWYKAYVTLDNQAFYGEVKTFTTDVVKVEGVSLDITEYTFHAIGNSLMLNATVFPSDATEHRVVWSSDRIDVATVDQSGNVEAVGYGNAVITATSIDQGKSATCVITVNQWVTSISFDKLSIPLIVGESVSLDATVNPFNATDQSLIWFSSDESIASVNHSTGVVVAAKRGTAVITATANDGSEVNASYKVIVRNPVPEGAVDLGLSVHWATHNVSVYSEGFNQDLCWFMWGTHKVALKFWYSSYPWVSWSSYKFYFYKYVTRSNNLPPGTIYDTVDNKTVLEGEDDTAYHYLGDPWRMPTEAECKELLDNCTCSWTTNDGKNGVRLTSTIEGFENCWIFLPAMGCRPGVNSAYTTYFTGENTLGLYWSSSLYLDDSLDDGAWCISFNSDGVSMSKSLRLNGLTIRPVSE